MAINLSFTPHSSKLLTVSTTIFRCLMYNEHKLTHYNHSCHSHSCHSHCATPIIHVYVVHYQLVEHHSPHFHTSCPISSLSPISLDLKSVSPLDCVPLDHHIERTDQISIGFLAIVHFPKHWRTTVLFFAPPPLHSSLDKYNSEFA